MAVGALEEADDKLGVVVVESIRVRGSKSVLKSVYEACVMLLPAWSTAGDPERVARAGLLPKLKLR